MRRELSLALVGGLLFCCGEAGVLRPVVEGSAPVQETVALPPGVFVVEAFDYHYPNETVFDSAGEELLLEAAVGQRTSASFVFVAESGEGDIHIIASDLRDELGHSLPSSAVELGVVTFFDRGRQLPFETSLYTRLDIVWRGGIQLGATHDNARGFHEDARTRLPLVPGPIVSDARDFAERAAVASPAVDLDVVEGAWAPSDQGAAQFFVTIRVPEEFAFGVPVTTLEGAITISTASEERELPLSLRVVNVSLDELGDHDKHVGVFLQTAPDLSGEFDESMLEDVRSRGANAVVAPFSAIDTYQVIRSHGFDLVFNDQAEVPLDLISELSAGGEEVPLLLDLFEPTDEEIAASAGLGQQMRDMGATVGAAMTLEVARSLSETLPPDFWFHAVTTYEAEEHHLDEFGPFLSYLEDLRAGDSTVQSPVAARQYHYAEVFNGHAPLLARILYGFWLFRSGLDGGFPWGYFNETEDSPFEQTGHYAVAFPARVTDGDSTSRRMIPTYTYEAFSEGINDFRLALTVSRLLAERGTPAQQEAFDAALVDYGPLYQNGDRVDYRNRASEVNQTRRQLFELLVALTE